ncbi:hypothetical protein TKK_0009519 [Trichogramma kaykai]
MDFHKIYYCIQSFIILLYGEPSFSRKLVNIVVKFLIKFITETFCVSLEKCIFEIIDKSKSKHEMKTRISECFSLHKASFDDFNSEKKRFNVLKTKGYNEPKPFEIKKNFKEIIQGNKILFVETPVSAYYLSLTHTLTFLLQIPKLAEIIINNIQKLSKKTKIISNIIQAKFWKKLAVKQEKNEFIIPIFIYFDDIEVGDALGSHSGTNKFGVVYTSLACLPSYLSSLLDLILFTMIVRCEHMKFCSNKTVFQKLIDDLNVLRQTGITVPVNNVPTTFKFQTVLILGDSLGLNSICGFVASFNSTKYCRICTADSCECSKLSCENEKLLRTRENYESNVVLKKPVETGILENCVFNKLDNFHIVTNKTIDFMHDVLEGVCIYVLRNILYEFIYNKKLFTLEFFNLRLQEFAMQSDNSNKPPPIKRNQFKEKLNIKYSAAEMLYLTRYFGIIIGDKVPIVNDHWKMYIYLREIVDILMSPRITDQFISVLKEKINSLNSSYVLHFQNLKPKFHFLTHYPSIIEEFGPCIHYWTMRHESRHRDIKANAVASNTHLNLLKTIATKQALKMCQVFDSFEADNNILFGPNIKKNNIHYQQVIINNSEYKVNSFLVISLANPDIQFGKIVSIKKLELKTGEVSVQFELEVYNELFFDKHIMAYVVSKDETSNKKFVKLNDIPSMPPVSAVKKGECYFIIPKYKL